MHRSLFASYTLVSLLLATATGCGTDGPVLTPYGGKDFAQPLSGLADDFVNPKAKLLRFEMDHLFHFEDLLTDQLHATGVSEEALLSLSRERIRGMGKDSWSDSILRDYTVQLNGIDICGAQVKALKLENSFDIMALVNIPAIDDASPSSNWTSEDTALTMTDFALRADGVEFDKAVNGGSSKCYLVRDGKLLPVRRVELLANDILYKAYVDDHGVYDLTAVNFHAEGTATVYESNPLESELKTFKLSKMSEGGTLENTFFTISTTGTKVQEDDFKFNYDPDDQSDEFDQTSLFVHANLQYDWFREMGHEWKGSNKLTIVAHAIISGSVNNALYTPGTSATPARIQVGDGDGIRLQNLPRDGDVVSHELGHHIVYDSLKEVKGESLVMHEGLADFFTFARTGDACLGESICPSGSEVKCELDTECLRTADNDYILGKNTKSEAHFKSQFISGMLWDLRESDIPSAKFDNIVYNGVALLLESSGYHDLVLGLLLADQDLYQGEYCEAIYNKAKARGLSDFISDFGCDGDLPSLNALNNSGGTTATKKRSGSTSDDPFCGVTGSQSTKTDNSFWWLLLIMLPVLMPTVHHLRKSLS